jgi:tetratricopeptide (TPR) repeat protein
MTVRLKCVVALLAIMLATTGVLAQTQNPQQPNRRARSIEPVAPKNSAAENGLQSAKAAIEQLEPLPQITRRQSNMAVDPEVMRGYTALQQNQFSQAREAYSQVLTKNPTQRDALLGIAYAHHALGDTAQALSTLRRLMDLYPRDSDASSALYLIGGGDPQAEETRFKQLLERSERPAILHYALGVLYFEQSRYGEAERSFSKAVSMDPDQPDYAYNLALSLDRLGRVRDAARQYVSALNLANQASAVFSRDVARSRLRVLTTAAQ